MSATVKFSALQGHSEFGAFVRDEKRWTLSADGERGKRGVDFIASSPFGSVESAVVVDPEGRPIHDRPLYREAPSVNVVSWGRDDDGTVKLAVISQPRPHSDDPLRPGENGHPPVVFGQIVMGFLEKLIGKDLIEAYESAEKGAIRETEEESGVRVIRSIERPSCPRHNPNPSFVATWSDLVFLEVDLAAIGRLKHDRNEPIFSAEYVTVKELMRRIREGRDEQGAYYRMCTANSAWMIFFATHPDLWAA